MSITDTLLGEAYYYLKQYYGNSINIPTSIVIPVSLQQKLSQEAAEEAEIDESVDVREPIGTQLQGENVLVNEHGETIAEMSVTELPTVLSQEGTTASNILGSPPELGKNQGKGTNKGTLSPPANLPENKPIQKNIKSPPSGAERPGGPPVISKKLGAQRPGGEPAVAKQPVAKPSGGLPSGGEPSGGPLPVAKPAGGEPAGGPLPGAQQPGAQQPGGEPPQSQPPDEGEIQPLSDDTCDDNIKTLIKEGKIVEAFEAAYIMDPWPYQCIKYILSIWPEDSINNQLESGSTPLIEAVKLGDISIVIGLIEKGADITKSDYNGETPIIHAARNGNTAILKLIHGEGGSLKQPTEGNGELKETVLMNAELKETVLMNAVKSGNLESVKYLIEKGVDIHEKTQNSKTAFLFACENGNLDIVKYLYERDASIINDKDAAGFTGLMLASSTHHLNVVKFLVENRPEGINDFNNQGNTALMFAAEIGAADIVQYLISKDADVNANMERTTGHTALMGAAAQDHKDVVNILLDNGADVNAQVGPNTPNEEEGRTALMFACESGNTEIVKMLLDNGADVNIKDQKGKTARDYASEQNIIKILESPSTVPVPVADRDNTATTIQKIARGWATRKKINDTKGKDTEIGLGPIIPDDSAVKTSDIPSKKKFINRVDEERKESEANVVDLSVKKRVGEMNAIAAKEAAKLGEMKALVVKQVRDTAEARMSAAEANMGEDQTDRLDKATIETKAHVAPLSVNPIPVVNRQKIKQIQVNPNKLSTYNVELQSYIDEITKINNIVDTLTKEDKTKQTQRREEILSKINEVQQSIQTLELTDQNGDMVKEINAQIASLIELLIQSKKLMERGSQPPSSVPSGGRGAVTYIAPVAKAYVKEVSSPRTSVLSNPPDAEVVPKGIVSENRQKLEVTKTASQMTQDSTKPSVKQAWGENLKESVKSTVASGEAAKPQSTVARGEAAKPPSTVAPLQAAQTQPPKKEAELKQAFNVLLDLNAQGIPTPEQIEKAESLAKDLKVDTEQKYSSVLDRAKNLLNEKTMKLIGKAINAVKKYIEKFTNNEPIINSSRTLEVISRYEERLNELIRKTNDDITKKINECEKINGRYYTTDDIRGAIENLTIEIEQLRQKMDHAKNLIKKKQTEIEKDISDQATILLRAIDTLSGKIKSATLKNITSIEKEYERILNSYKELNVQIPAYLSSRPFYTVITEVTTKLFSLGPDIKRKKDTLEAQKSGTKVPSLLLSAGKSTSPLLQSNSARDKVSEKQQTLYSSASAPTSPRVLRADKPPEKTYDVVEKEYNDLLSDVKNIPRPSIKTDRAPLYARLYNIVRQYESNAKFTSEQNSALKQKYETILDKIKNSRYTPTPENKFFVKGGKKTKRTRPKQPIHTSRRCQRKIKYTNNKTNHKKPHPTNKTKNRRT